MITHNNNNNILFDIAEQSDIVLYYNGDISQKIIENLGKVVKLAVQNDTHTNIFYKIFSVFIEQTQNILHYSAPNIISQKTNQPCSRGMILLAKVDNRDYILIAGNLISIDQQIKLKTILDEIKKMNKDDIKKLYKKTLHKNVSSKRNGAGVGLIEIAQQASEPIEYHFTKVDKKYSYYSIKAVIKNDHKNKENSDHE